MSIAAPPKNNDASWIKPTSAAGS
jgi:hypothetical protein